MGWRAGGGGGGGDSGLLLKVWALGFSGLLGKYSLASACFKGA